jgi:16S rRNA (cytosine967-C5)-methyltransferase
VVVSRAAPAERVDPHGLAPRRAALHLVSAVLDAGRSLDAARSDPALAGLSGPELARASDLAEAVLRWLRPVDATLAALMRKPLAAKARTARDALRLAVAETAALGTPPHATVDAAVRLTRADRATAALSGLVNAVARRATAAPPVLDPQRMLPDWLAASLAGAWGEAALSALAQPAATDLTLRDPAQAELWAARLGAQLLPTGSLRLARGGQITALPGFAEGAWWVQDAAAALPARLLGARPGQRVLDLCAAPGGKTLQLAAAGAHVTALDIAEDRLARLHENLARTGLTAEIVAADALSWSPAEPFDAILLDAPCTATGTLRRHPDLPHLRRPGDAARLAALQDSLLDRAAGWLKPGGRLVFATCSLLPEEGEARAAAFLQRQPSMRRLPVTAAETGEPAFVSAPGDLRTRPDHWADTGGIDGFFAARLTRD